MRARLYGGPFDGDSSSLERTPVPPSLLYVAPCAHGARCPVGEIHWYLDRDSAERHHRDAVIERYVQAGHSPLEVRYVWSGLPSAGLRLLARSDRL